MTTEELKAIGLTDDQVKQVFALNGKAIEKLKTEAGTYKQQAETAQKGAQDEVNAVKFEYALLDALKKAGARNPQLVKSLLDLDALQFDGQEIQGLEQQLEAIKNENGYLFEDEGGKKAPVFAKPAQGKADTGKGITKEQIKNMTPEEINQNWAQIQEVLKRG